MSAYRDLIKKGCEFRYGEVEIAEVAIDFKNGKVIGGMRISKCNHEKRDQDHCCSNCPVLKASK